MPGEDTVMDQAKYEKIMYRQAVEDCYWIARYASGCHDVNIAYWQFVRTFGRKPVPLKRG